MHLALQSVGFALILGVTRHPVDWAFAWLIPLAVATAVVVCAALALLLAPLNVYARDTMHLLDMLVLGWFWVTPILYQYERAADWFERHGIGEWILLVNPATPIVITVQRAVYGSDHAGDVALLPTAGPMWYLGVLGFTAALWAAVLIAALWAFEKADVHLVETL
jgi:ABC-2 type transport system permease protein